MALTTIVMKVDEGVLNACMACGELKEVCNDIDDDCDTKIDEGLVNACGMCGDPMPVLPQEVCDENDNDCDGQVDEGVKNKCGTCGDEPAEVCDGADNDCDQRTDEGDDICAVGERCECARCVKPCPGGLNECPGGALCVEGFCLPRMRRW